MSIPRLLKPTSWVSMGRRLRDERAVIPIGSYNPTYGVTLSLPSVVGRQGVVRILEPDLSEDERQALQRSAETLRRAVARMQETRAAAAHAGEGADR